MRPTQNKLLTITTQAMKMANDVGCKCHIHGAFGDHENSCYLPRLRVALARMRDDFGVGSENEQGLVGNERDM